MMKWTSLKDLRQQVQILWDKGVILKSILEDEPCFPKRLSLKTPTSKELSGRFPEVQQWIRELQQSSNFRIEMKNVRHKILGDNIVPSIAWLDSFEDAVSAIGKQKEVKQFIQLVDMTQKRNSRLLDWFRQKPLKALSLSEHWSKFLDIVDWMNKNPQSGIYLRQVDIMGIDTKFIESHLGILTELLDLSLSAAHINQHNRGVSQFEARYGFMQKPLRVRFRLLDPATQLIGSATQDLGVTHENFYTMDADERFMGRIRRVFITENEINFLVFPNVSHSIVIFGSGYGFDALANIPWLKPLEVYYWGDLDTHGFAILDQLRSKIPQAQSLLMDEPTLLAHRSLWGKEDKQEKRKLSRLTRPEQCLYKDLGNNRFAENIRLEQERIGFQWLEKRLEIFN